MSEKRSRKNNWSQEENEALEHALLMFGRNDIDKILLYLEQHVPGFNRTYKDVKKKIYNSLQEDIFHEISVKVRIILSYAVLMIYNDGREEVDPTNQFVGTLSKFCKHEVARIQNNYKVLRRDPRALSMGTKAVRTVMEHEKIAAVEDLINNKQHYIKLLRCFQSYMD